MARKQCVSTLKAEHCVSTLKLGQKLIQENCYLVGQQLFKDFGNDRSNISSFSISTLILEKLKLFGLMETIDDSEMSLLLLQQYVG